MPPGITSSTAASARRFDDDREVDTIPQKKPYASPIVSAAQDAYGAEAAREALRAFNDGILYVGMNEKSMKTESDALSKTAKVEKIFTREGATVVLDGASYDLGEKEEIAAFAEALAEKYGLPAATRSAIADVLAHATLEGRDELAQIAMVWARAESGRPGEKAIPSRLVVSGHHSGSSFSGLRDESLFALARAMPRAARQIEDVHFAGCMSEQHVNLRDEIRHAFPNLKTVWAYSGYSPLAPVDHLQAWAAKTAGRADRIASVPGHGVIAWSARGGVVGATKSLEERRRECRDADARFDAYKAGTLPKTFQTDDDYAAYQAIAQSNAPANERADAAAKAAVLLRIRKYEHVREKFDAVYGARVRAACAKAGIDAPRFASLSRKEAVERIAAIEAKVAAFDPDLRTKLVGFAELDAAVVLDGWCY